MTKYAVWKYTCNKCGKDDLRQTLASYGVPGTISPDEVKSYQKKIECAFCGHDELTRKRATDEEIINSGKIGFAVTFPAKNEFHEIIKKRHEWRRSRDGREKQRQELNESRNE